MASRAWRRGCEDRRRAATITANRRSGKPKIDFGDRRPRAEQIGALWPAILAPGLDAADPSACLPGDLAVTANGLHVMIAVGAGAWIEADPGLLSVVVVTTPSPANPWFGVPVRFVRWRRLT